MVLGQGVSSRRSGIVQENTATLDLPSLRDRQNLREQVAHALRAAIVAGSMRPGVIYSAPALAARVDVSATPVREALLDLSSEGLVRAVRNKGFRVTQLSEQDLDDIAALRALIEVPTVAEVASGPRALEANELRGAAREIVDAAAHADLIRYVETDRKFHLALLSLAGNQQLVDTVRMLRARSRLYGLKSMAERGALVRSAREHEDLVNLVSSGDATGAADLMRLHIAHIRSDWASHESD